MHYGLLLVALMSLSTASVIIKWSQTPASQLGFWRLIGAGFLVVGFQFIRDGNLKNITFSKWSWLSGLFFFLHLWTYMLAAHHTSIAHMVVIYATNPIYAIWGAYTFFNEPIAKRVYLAYLAAFLGILILMYERLAQGFSLFGNMMALFSAVLHAGYFLSAKKARQFQSNISFSVALYLVSACGFYLLTYFEQTQLVNLSLRASIAVGLLILLPTLLGHFLMTYLMNTMALSKLSFSKLIEPGLSTLFAYFILSEQISSYIVIAFTLTSVAVALGIMESKTNK